MSRFTTFDDLKSKRKEMVRSMKENDAFDGIKNLLTELYPDKAHFIYELLQNAEDMNATEVKFQLFKDKLIFTHNGDKREFTLDDIEAITNISKGTKKDDPTTIGQFGVGFKAVYAYTNTPEIYSGHRCFKIIDMLIPEDEGVLQQSQKGQTKFVFPFDNDDKPQVKAFEEIAEGLCSLDETAILFLNHIKTINYELPDGTKGYIKVDATVSSVKFIIGIQVKTSKLNEHISYWSKFNEKCPIVVDGKLKNHIVSLAYRMNLLSNGNFGVDSSLIGKVCIFFPTDQKSDLHFHINAPFASTVARDNIRYCEENDKLIEALANLSVESLYYFRGVNLLDYSVYEAMPTIKDFSNSPNSRYKIFAEQIKKAFESDALFITEQGDYLKSESVMWASVDVKNILPLAEVKLYYQKSWLPRFTPTSRIDLFINQFKIKEYTIEDFINSLEADPHFFDVLFAKENAQYFKTLYYLFSQAKERTNRYYSFYNLQNTRDEILKEVAFIKCEDETLHKPTDKIYLKTSYQPKLYLKNPIYVCLDSKNNPRDNTVRSFLQSLGIKEMTESEDMTADISDNASTDDMVLKAMEVIEVYKSSPSKINEYYNKPIFLVKDSTGEIYRSCAHEGCWSNAVAFFYPSSQQYILVQEAYLPLDDDFYILKEIFKKLGGKVMPQIYESDLDYSHPQYNRLNRTSREMSASRIRSDYTIKWFDWNKIRKIKEENLINESLVLWKFVLSLNSAKYIRATYRANSSASTQHLESSLVYYLKRTAWIPTKNRGFIFPYEITQDDLLDEYMYEIPSAVLEEICKKPNDEVELLQNSGASKELIAFAEYDSDVQECALAIAAQMQERKQKTGKSLSELATASDRSQSPEEDDEDDFGIFHKPKNTDKRRLKLEKEFDDREDLPTFIKKLQFVLEKPNTEEKSFVRNEYHAHCQLCGNEGILTAKGKRYFEAINIFNTGKLDDSLQIKLDLGWNTLCLCPNCAAKFKYSQLTISGLIEQVEHIDVSAVQSAFIDISITLENKPTTIRFTSNHLLSLQVAIKKIKEIEKNS